MKHNKYHPHLTKFIHTFFITVSILMILPLVLVISISFTEEQTLFTHGYQLIPSQLSLDAYRLIFKAPDTLLKSYGVTIVRTALGTWFSVLLTALTAYVISRPNFRYSKIITILVFITILFKPSLIPSYIMVTQVLNLRDTLWAMILPALFNPFFVLVVRGFIKSTIPEEIIDSAKIDGASEFRIFVSIVLPLMGPALATIAVLKSFFFWNDWWLALLYIDNPDLAPLQLLLYRLQSRIDFILANPDLQFELGLAELPSLSLRMAMVVVAAGPMMFVFPFFRKFFVRGITVGSTK